MLHEPDQKLLNVHEILNDAAFLDAMEAPIQVGIKMPEHLKEIASDICRKNGTTLSGFLRQCCVQLAREYGGKI